MIYDHVLMSITTTGRRRVEMRDRNNKVRDGSCFRDRNSVEGWWLLQSVLKMNSAVNPPAQPKAQPHPLGVRVVLSRLLHDRKRRQHSFPFPQFNIPIIHAIIHSQNAHFDPRLSPSRAVVFSHTLDAL
jgi:hypothetical protein